MQFQLNSEFKPTGDQPKAIEELSNGILNNDRYQTLLGVTGSGKHLQSRMLYKMCNVQL